jgi:hypothetical protein
MLSHLTGLGKKRVIRYLSWPGATHLSPSTIDFWVRPRRNPNPPSGFPWAGSAGTAGQLPVSEYGFRHLQQVSSPLHSVGDVVRVEPHHRPGRGGR